MVRQLFLGLLALHCALADHGEIPCEGHVHHYFDGSSCKMCSRGPCGIGLFRETCSESSTQDAQCVPCKPPPAENAVHTSGGLPFMQDNCMWACQDGFYRDKDLCVACNTDPCPEGMVRQQCPLGRYEDAKCVCPIDTFMDADKCTPCQVTQCAEDQQAIRCLGIESSDVSRCSTVQRRSDFLETFPHPP